MYIVTRGTALELQDKLAGEAPVEVNEKYTEVDEKGKEVEKVKVVLKKVDTVSTLGGLVRLSDDVYVQAFDAEVSDWTEGDSSSDSAE